MNAPSETADFVTVDQGVHDRRAILVLGMHRSGTSALTGILGKLGVPLGADLSAPGQDNPKGFWEHRGVVAAHERLLADLGMRWDDVRPLPAGWMEGEPARRAASKLNEVIGQEFAGMRLWAVKDPRLCRFLPLWLAVLANLGIDPVALFMVRDPGEVAASIKARDHWGLIVGELLWLRYVVEAEEASRAIPRSIVTFDDLLADPLNAVKDALSKVGVRLGDEPPAQLRRRIEEFIAQSDRHHQLAEAGKARTGYAGLACRLYAKLTAVGHNDVTWSQVARLGAEFNREWQKNGADIAVFAEMASKLAARYSKAADEAFSWATKLDAELVGARAGFAKAVGDGERVSAWGKEMDAELVATHDELKGLRRELTAVRSELASKRDELAEAHSGLTEASDELTEVRGDLVGKQDELARAHSDLATVQQQLAGAHDELAATRGELANAHSELATMQHQLTSTRGDLATTQQQLADTRGDLATTHQQLADTRGDLATTHQQLADTRGELATTQQQLADTHGSLTDSNEQLAVARGELAKARVRLRELELIKASRSWRWTRPLRFLARTVRGRGLGEQDRLRLRRRFAKGRGVEAGPQVLAAPLAPVAAIPTAVAQLASAASEVARAQAAMPTGQLASQITGQRDYFVWAVIDWHFRTQRPQHVASELVAAGHRAFYVSNNFVDDSQAGFAVEPLDAEGRLFQVHLHLQGAPQIYHAAPDAQQREQLRASLGELLAWTGTRGCVSLVQHPYWLEIARILPDSLLVYDCMDHHGGFAGNSADALTREGELMRESDLLVVTSDWLYRETGKYNPHRLVVRNACEYEHFGHRSPDPFKDPKGRKVVGYYGAIAEWFDLELVEKLARRLEDCLILLVGLDTIGARERLAHLANVEFVGEVPYRALPRYLDGFDVCMLPFQIIPLTLATNPVKAYEYLSAGKDVVSVDLPELRKFDGLVRIAENHDAFIEAVAESLRLPPDPALVGRRQQFAAGQTWSQRVRVLEKEIGALHRPRVSVIVVTYNNLELNKICLDSIERLSEYNNMEVIVVDNASADDTPAFLREWVQGGTDRKIILNADNLGFAAGNNLGLAAADGDYFVLLNNDTHVTPGWVATLLAHLRRDQSLGMVGPVTNNIGNEARIEIQYDDMNSMQQAAANYTARHVGLSMPLRTVAFFCVMLRRSVYDQIGPLDEQFGVGFFEDDDYCQRVRQAGWGVACAEDVFIHHQLSASFNQLKQERRQALFDKNKALYEAKWGPWIPHSYRKE